MDLNEYQEQAKRTWQLGDSASGGQVDGYDQQTRRIYCALGMNGEAGEVADHFKKLLRDDEGRMTDARFAAIVDEMGDVLWYVAMLADQMELSLETVAEQTLNKLRRRYG